MGSGIPMIPRFTLQVICYQMRGVDREGGHLRVLEEIVGNKAKWKLERACKSSW